VPPTTGTAAIETNGIVAVVVVEPSPSVTVSFAPGGVVVPL
jgi:hypothetical protein